MNEAKKNDQEKRERPELIPPEFISGTARVLKHGADKYAAGNWSKGFD